ncbi:hypothetical protein [Arthrobacter sp. KNU40]|uniref:hypothetical protein n=1 Tax=Arthrobacter sp. KNU40 TaxID=3447965 RepID=UPI003F63A458
MFRNPDGVEDMRLHAVNIHTSASLAMNEAENLSNAVEHYRTTMYQLLNTHDVLDRQDKLAAVNRKLNALNLKICEAVDDLSEIVAEIQS